MIKFVDGVSRTRFILSEDGSEPIEIDDAEIKLANNKKKKLEEELEDGPDISK